MWLGYRVALTVSESKRHHRLMGDRTSWPRAGKAKSHSLLLLSVLSLKWIPWNFLTKSGELSLAYTSALSPTVPLPFFTGVDTLFIPCSDVWCFIVILSGKAFCGSVVLIGSARKLLLMFSLECVALHELYHFHKNPVGRFTDHKDKYEGTSQSEIWSAVVSGRSRCLQHGHPIGVPVRVLAVGRGFNPLPHTAGPSMNFWELVVCMDLKIFVSKYTFFFQR